jgi:hypothetical protein
VRTRFPEIPAQALVRRVHLVDTAGRVFAGAHGILKMRALCGQGNRLLSVYERNGWLARILEFGYALVARNRHWLNRFANGSPESTPQGAPH